MKIRITSILLTMAMMMGLSAHSFAVDPHSNEEWLVKYDEKGTVYLENSITGEKAVRAVQFDEQGNPYDVDLISYAAELNATGETAPVHMTASEPSSILPLSGNSGTRYEETRWYYQTGEARKVSPTVKASQNGATISYGESITIENSFSGGITFTAAVKKIIQGGVSFSWNESLSTSSSFGVTFTLNDGQSGYIAFLPRFIVSQGTYYEERITTTAKYSITAKSPIKLATGYADGTYMLVLV